LETNLNYLQALALAIIQGLTEFLPVSSSGHLVLARRLFEWSDDGGLIFDTVLHAGSLAAILIYFWQEWVLILRAYLLKSKIQNPKSKIDDAYYRRLPWLIIVATIPVVIAGPLLKPGLENDAIARTSWITGLSMIMTALLFLLAESRPPPPSGKPISFLNSLFIGCMQIVALLPGASRSGWTTAGGILCGQNRENAVRFAFFMAIPAIAGAIFFQGREMLHSPQASHDPLLVITGFIASFAASLGAIHFCLRYFRSHSLRPFAVYLIIIGFLALLLN
jgi:undecaprenyl-diphosphatase